MESLEAGLKRLNEFLHAEHNINPSHRVNIVSALMIASLGVEDGRGGFLVDPLAETDLKGRSGKLTDGKIISDRVEAYLEHRTPKLTKEKQEAIVGALRPTLLNSALNKVGASGLETPLRAVFNVVSQKLLSHYKADKGIDFTGTLFHEMYSWVQVPDGGANDVVLTPKRTTDLMVALTNVHADSYVWDWTLGTGAFLVSAMNAMLADAEKHCPADELARKK